MSLRAAPEAGKLSPPKLLLWVTRRMKHALCKDACNNGVFNGRLIFYHYWCWRAGSAAPVKTSTGNNFLENTREFPEIITSTGAKFGLRFCLSVLVLVIFKSPISTVMKTTKTKRLAIFTKTDNPLWQLGRTLWATGPVHQQMRRRTTNTNTKHATYWLQP